MDPLFTKRLILRPLVAGDFAALSQLYTDVDMMRYISGQPRTRQQTLKRLKGNLLQHQRYGFGLCAVLWRRNGQFVGRGGIEPREEEEGLAGELAWMVAKKWWGSGLGLEMAEAFLHYGRKNLDLVRLFATADLRNKHSISIMQKLGMVKVGEDNRRVEFEIRS